MRLLLQCIVTNLSTIKCVIFICWIKVIVYVCLWRFFKFIFFVTDPFDLNHNLGAGLSRKSKRDIDFYFFPPFLTSQWFFLHFSLLKMCMFLFWSSKQWQISSWRLLSMAEECLAHPSDTFLLCIPVRWSVFVVWTLLFFFLLWWYYPISTKTVFYLHLSQEYFFDPEVLTEGEVAPNDRCCRICGKIGHFMKDCPLRKKWVQSQVFCHNIYLSLLAPCVPALMLMLHRQWFWTRSKHRRDSERRPEYPQDKMDIAEESKDQVRHKSEHWRKRDGVDIRCCYLCGSTAHIKKDCQLYRSPAGKYLQGHFTFFEVWKKSLTFNIHLSFGR